MKKLKQYNKFITDDYFFYNQFETIKKIYKFLI